MADSCTALVLTSLMLSQFVSDEKMSCSFDFEDPKELMNFDTQCDGAKGSWDIVDSTNPLSTTGDRALTVIESERACLLSGKEFTVNDELTIGLDLYWGGPLNGTAELTLKLVCDGIEVSNWDVLKECTLTDTGEWLHAERIVTDIGSSKKCQMRIEMYRMIHVLEIDEIVLQEADPTECYTVPKPPLSSSTTSSSSSETSPTSSSTETSPTSSSSETIPTSSSSETSPASSSSETSPASSPSETSPTSSSSETSPASSSSETSPASSPSETSPASSTSSSPSFPGSSTPQTPDSTVPDSTLGTPPPSDGNLGGTSMYMVTIIASCGGLALLMGLTCCIIILLRPRISRMRRKSRNGKVFMPRKINML